MSLFWSYRERKYILGQIYVLKSGWIGRIWVELQVYVDVNEKRICFAQNRISNCMLSVTKDLAWFLFLCLTSIMLQMMFRNSHN